MYEILAAETQAQSVNWTLIIVGIIGSGALTAILNWRFNKRKDGAETIASEASAAEMIQKASAALIQQVQEQSALSLQFQKDQNIQLMQQVSQLEGQVNRLEAAVQRIPLLEADITELTRGVHLLVQQLRENNITPVYPPPPPIL